MSENSQYLMQEVPDAPSPVVQSGDLPVGDLAALLNVKDETESFVDLPAWNMRVKVRSLSKNEQMRLRKMATRNNKVDSSELEGLILVHGMVEPKITVEHLHTLYNKNSGYIDKILAEILTLSGVLEKKEDESEADFR